MRRLTTACAVLAALALVAAACGSSSSSGGGTAVPKVYDSIGTTEGALKLIAWNGYTENGSNDPNYDWVTPFQDQTGCKVTVKYADTSDEMVTLMRQGGGGSIINISSQLGLVGMDDSSPQYQASKGAVRLLTKLTALQYARERIRANSVHPGPILTPMTERRRADPAVYQRMVSRIPLGRYGEPDEVAYGVLYLASDESSFVTGSELVIDGGWTAQ